MHTFAHVTDIHLDQMAALGLDVDARRQWQMILEDLQVRGIREIVFGGDIGEGATLPWFFDSLKAFEVHLVLGNHDKFTQVQPHYHAHQGVLSGTLDYHYEAHGHRWIFLDSSRGMLESAQVDWLHRTLSTESPIILTVHHPLLPVNTEQDRRFPLRDREPVLNILRAHQHPITILCGHYHCEDDQTVGHIRQILTPAASYQIEKHPKDIKVNGDGFGYRLIKLGEDAIEENLIWFENEPA